MKKLFFLLYIIVLATGSAFAQETTPVQDVPEPLKSKRGVPILPEYGEWGLGVSANPFLQYAGNLLSGAFNPAPGFELPENPTDNIAIFGKYIVDENTAYRVRFNINVRSTANKAAIGLDQVNPDPLAPAFTEDWQKNNVKNFVLAAGLEKRRGVSRLQGVYGGELVFGFSNFKREYQYGNSINATFNTPNTFDFGNNIGGGDERVIEENFGSSFSVGARGFIGVEYFFAPKISLGGEFGYTLGFSTEGKTVVTTEQWNATTQSVLEIKSDANNGSGPFGTGVSSFGIGIDNFNAQISLLFYF